MHRTGVGVPAGLALLGLAVAALGGPSSASAREPGTVAPAPGSEGVGAAAHVAVAPLQEGAPAGREIPAQEAEHAQQEGPAEEAGHAQEAEHAEWDTETMIHHITEDRVIDLGFTQIDLSPLSVPPIHVAGLEIDLSITRHVIFLFIASILTILTMWLAAREARRLEHGAEAPGGVLNAVEAFYLYLRDEVAMASIGRGGERFVPLVIALFFFILYANLLGLVPWGATATSNIMVTAALAFISLLVIEYAGYKELGFKGYMGTIFYVPHGLHPAMAAVMLVIMTPVELLGKLAKPFALAVRLFANMTAGHFVILALLGLIITYGSFSQAAGLFAILGPIALGLFVMFLEIFVAFLQAYIFAMLTAVFIGLIRAH